MKCTVILGWMVPNRVERPFQKSSMIIIIMCLLAQLFQRLLHRLALPNTGLLHRFVKSKCRKQNLFCKRWSLCFLAFSGFSMVSHSRISKCIMTIHINLRSNNLHVCNQIQIGKGAMDIWSLAPIPRFTKDFSEGSCFTRKNYFSREIKDRNVFEKTEP